MANGKTASVVKIENRKIRSCDKHFTSKSPFEYERKQHHLTWKHNNTLLLRKKITILSCKENYSFAYTFFLKNKSTPFDSNTKLHKLTLI